MGQEKRRYRKHLNIHPGPRGWQAPGTGVAILPGCLPRRGLLLQAIASIIGFVLFCPAVQAVPPTSITPLFRNPGVALDLCAVRSCHGGAVRR